MEVEPGIEPRYTDLQAVDFGFFLFIKQYLTNLKVGAHSLDPLQDYKVITLPAIPQAQEIPKIGKGRPLLTAPTHGFTGAPLLTEQIG